MSIRTLTIRSGFGLAVAGLMVSTASLAARDAEVTLIPQCEVTVAAEQVPIQAEPVTVAVRHSAALGEEVSAVVADDSGAGVIGIGRSDDDEPMTLQLTLDTSEATAGEWAITLSDGEQQCTGTMTLVQPEAR